MTSTPESDWPTFDLDATARTALSRRRVLSAVGLAAAAAAPISLAVTATAAAAQPSFRTMATPRLKSFAGLGEPCGPNYLGGLKLDTDNTPLSLLKDSWVSHPTVQGNFLNRHMQSYETDKQRGHLTMVGKCLDGIVGRAKKSGAAIMPTYNFPWDARDGMETNWVSSFGQSKFPAAAHRMYISTGDRKWLGMRDAFMAAFELPVSATAPYVAGVDGSGYLWLDEYPNERGLSRVFNGHMYALSELLRYSEISGDKRALELVRGAVTTAFAYRNFCRQPGRISRYYVARTEALSSYQSIHHGCFVMMHRYTGLLGFAQTADQLRHDWCVDNRAGSLRVLPNVSHVIRSGSLVKRWTPTTELRTPSPGRGCVNDSNVWSKMGEGPYKGWLIQESSAAFRTGFETDSTIFEPRPLWFGPGRHDAYAFSSNGLRYVRKTINLTSRSQASAVRVAKIGGRWYWLVANGAFQGLWVAEGANNYFAV